MVQMVQVLPPPDRQGWLVQFVQIRWAFFAGGGGRLAIEMQLGAISLTKSAWIVS